MNTCTMLHCPPCAFYVSEKFVRLFVCVDVCVFVHDPVRQREDRKWIQFARPSWNCHGRGVETRHQNPGCWEQNLSRSISQPRTPQGHELNFHEHGFCYGRVMCAFPLCIPHTFFKRSLGTLCQSFCGAFLVRISFTHRGKRRSQTSSFGRTNVQETWWNRHLRRLQPTRLLRIHSAPWPQTVDAIRLSFRQIPSLHRRIATWSGTERLKTL